MFRKTDDGTTLSQGEEKVKPETEQTWAEWFAGKRKLRKDIDSGVKTLQGVYKAKKGENALEALQRSAREQLEKQRKQKAIDEALGEK